VTYDRYVMRNPWRRSIGGPRDARDARGDEAIMSAPDHSGRGIGALAVGGATVVLLRSAGVAVFGLVGNIVLARMLLPRDFGLVAFGITLVVAGTFVAQGGVAIGYVRRPADPTRTELGALVGLQLVLTSLVTACLVAASLPFGRAGEITAFMVLSLPVLAVRTPGFILLERSLDFRRIAAVEVTEALVYYAWAVTAVAVGWGVWGLASATLIRAVTGTIVMLKVSPVSFPRPSFAWNRARSQLAFGSRFQASQLANLARYQGLNAGTVAIAGTGALGQWVLARQVLQVPMLLFDALLRVSYPATARLVAAGTDLRPVIERAAGMTAVATGLLLAPLAATSSTFVPLLFGARWEPAGSVIPWACAGLAFGGPVSVAAAGALYALGDAATPLRATVASSAAWGVVTFALLSTWGVPALGAGWFASCVVDSAILGRGVQTRVGVRLLPEIAAPVTAAFVAAAMGWTTARALGGGAWAGGIAAVLVVALYAGALAIVRREQTIADIRTVVSAWSRSRRTFPDGREVVLNDG
jgi:O-antigen/teichoic acid export membrane protein